MIDMKETHEEALSTIAERALTAIEKAQSVTSTSSEYSFLSVLARQETPLLTLAVCHAALAICGKLDGITSRLEDIGCEIAATCEKLEWIGVDIAAIRENSL